MDRSSQRPSVPPWRSSFGFVGFVGFVLFLLCARLSNAQVIQLPLSDYSVTSVDGDEGGVARFIIWINAQNTQVHYYTVDGTAKAGVDYLPVSGTATNSVDVQITLPDDGKVEPPKTIKLVTIQQSADIARTNTTQAVIFDSEIPRIRDDSFRPAFQPRHGYFDGHVTRFASGRVLPDDRIVVAEPDRVSILDPAGRVQSQFLFPEWTRTSLWISAVAPDASVILARVGNNPAAPAFLKFRPDGSQDENFNPQLPVLRVLGLTVTPEGKILTAFSHTNDAEWLLVQLNLDGTPNPAFTPVRRQWLYPPASPNPVVYHHIGLGLDGAIQVVHPNERSEVIIKANRVEVRTNHFSIQQRPEIWLGGGVFLVARMLGPSFWIGNSLYRLRPDGTLDESFAAGSQSQQFIYLGTQRDGKVVALSGSELLRLNSASETTNHVRVTSLSGREEDASAYFILERTGETTQPRAIRIQTHEAKAKAGVDFHTLDTLVTFEPLQTYVTANFSIINDDLSEGPEDFTVELTSPNNDALVPSTQFEAFIYDEEPYMKLMIDPVKNGTVRVWKDYYPEWNATLQTSTNLGRTWTEIGLSTSNTWSFTAPSHSPTIFRTVKAD